MSPSEPEFVLHIWPGKWDLPTFDPQCLAAVIYLQNCAPIRFRIVESTNPDLSPTGSLPYLSHGERTIAPLSAIFDYVATKHDPVPDESLTSSQKSRKVAWYRHMESNLGDLVSHMFYARHTNWSKLTHPALASVYSLPHRYYVPFRIRDAYQPRLEASGLWDAHVPDAQEKKSMKERVTSTMKDDPKHNDTFHSVFEREKVLEKARPVFDIYTRLLGDNQFFLAARITTLDIIFAAHILLLLRPPFPDPLLKDLLNTSYPTLVAHANLVYSRAFSEFSPPIHTTQPSHSFKSLVPYLVNGNEEEMKQVSGSAPVDARLGWNVLAVGTLALYGLGVALTSSRRAASA